MINRLYVNNFRCLVAFETQFDSFGVLCGPNGSGKSSVFDALRLVQSLATGEGVLGGDGERDVPHLDFTNWLSSKVQEFEIDVDSGGQRFGYVLHIEQTAEFEKPRIVKEQASCDGRLLFERDLDGVRFRTEGGREVGFPLDWRQAALSSIQPRGALGDIETLQQTMARLLILRPNPRAMERESKSKAKHPDLHLGNLTSWYRSLAQDDEFRAPLGDALREVWPDFRSFKLEDVGLNTEALRLRFGDLGGCASSDLFFHQLSDGEKGIIGLYMIRAALMIGAVETVLIDEPDNYVGLPELQPWVLSMRELLAETRQAVLITHHPEVLSSAGAAAGRYLWRDNHTSPTRIGPLDVPEGLTPGEAVARGWVRG